MEDTRLPEQPADAIERRQWRQRRRFSAGRFYADQAAPHWKDSPDLASACQQADMTVHQAEACRCAKMRKTYGQIGEALGLPYPKARDVVERAWAKFRKVYKMGQRQRTYHREVLDCWRNRMGGGAMAQSPLVGMVPWRNHNAAGAKSDPQNYQQVSFRSPIAAAEDFAPDYSADDPLSLLTEAVRRFEEEAQSSKCAA